MTTDRWERIAHLYQTAAELPPEDRAPYLEAACADDPGLRGEVESLLAQAGASVLIDRPVWEPAAHVLEDNSAVLPGTLLGPYRIDAFVGEGGMGQVYRARDTTLQRDVALKVLPAGFAGDPDRLARFGREAQVLAALNHPHVGAIYGVQRSADAAAPPVHALVLEFVEGPTLADRIAQGPLPLDEALPIARQIADAVEAAHEQGIVHRDLKPANIKLRPDGTVKVLDFGLAKALDSGTTPQASASSSPTLASPVVASGVGVLLGTAAYMSPEQARGRPADKRSDIWGFGCVMFEMLTAARAFSGKDVSDTLAAILRDEPDWDRLPSKTPAAIVRLLRRCLEKDHKRRLPAISAVRFEIDEALAGRSIDERESDRAAAADWRRRGRWVTGTALVAGAVLGSIVTWRGTQVPPDTRVTRFTILQPADTVLGGYLRTGNPTSQPQFAVSPDGRHVVMVASRASVESLWLHSLDSNEIRQLAGTEGAGQPFWSPDSRLLAFFAAGRLKKLLIAGGQPIEICETGEGRGGTWNRDDVIVFKSERPETEEPGNRGLQRVPAGGGIPAAATAVDAPDVTSHSWPYFLPDGRHFLYVAASATPDWEIRVGSLGSSQVTRIGSTRSAVVYGAGHLFFWKDGSVVAQAFDPVSLRTAGTPLPVADGVGRGAMGDMSFSISDAGTVVFAPVIRPSLTQLTWFDRAGRPLATVGAPERNAAFALSPDGRRIVVTRDTELPGSQHLWIVDVASGLGSQLTFGQSGVATLPVWSHDSTRVAFSKGGTPVASELFVTSADGHGKEEQLLTDRGNEIPSDWSPDGRFLLFTQVNARDLDVWVLPLTGERKPFPFTESQGREDNATFSPDGRWVAYQSDELGETEIFVQPFPPTGAKFRVSRDGGRAPRWRNNGQEIFYIGRDGSVVAAPIALGDKVPTVGVQQTLFSTEYNRRRGRRFFSVTGDGQRFLMPVYQDPVPATPLHVILNWPATLAK